MKYRKLFKARTRKFYFLKYKKLFRNVFFLKYKFCFWKPQISYQKYKKSFLLRKCKIFLNIRARKFHFLGVKQYFWGGIFFSSVRLKSVPASSMLYYFPYFIGRNAKEVIKSLELESNDLMEWFSNNKMKVKKKINE